MSNHPNVDVSVYSQMNCVVVHVQVIFLVNKANCYTTK